MNLPPILQGESRVRLTQGIIIGCALTLLLGFGCGGWQLQSKAKMAPTRASARRWWRALTPICVEKFPACQRRHGAKGALTATDSWKQDSFVEKGGWATFPGKTEPYRLVAEACAKILTEAK